MCNSSARTVADGFASYDVHFHGPVGSADALWGEFTSADADVLESEGPTTQEIGIRDFTVRDPDGYVLVFRAPLE